LNNSDFPKEQPTGRDAPNYLREGERDLDLSRESIIIKYKSFFSISNRIKTMELTK
jgi:hypothetical protein